MSTNISDIMFKMEAYGIPKDVVRYLVRDLLAAGRRTVLAALGEIAGHATISEIELELTVANLVVLADREIYNEKNSRKGVVQREAFETTENYHEPCSSSQ